MDISTWLIDATKQLKHIGILSPRLDAELILANTLRKNRTYLHAHLDEVIDSRRVDIANARLQLRCERVPLAYILGYKEFYGRKFKVTPATLVPRPESEDMITELLRLTSSDISSKNLIDIGTGSGCLGITAKLERPSLQVLLTDISDAALQVAEENAQNLGAEVRLRKQDLLYGHIEPLDYILANLPYVDRAWETSPEVQYEPSSALYADSNGLALITDLLKQTTEYLRPNGYLLLEADPEQHTAIIEHAERHSLELGSLSGYIVSLRRVSA